MTPIVNDSTLPRGQLEPSVTPSPKVHSDGGNGMMDTNPEIPAEIARYTSMVSIEVLFVRSIADMSAASTVEPLRSVDVALFKIVPE
jgi:hypothetical protein